MAEEEVGLRLALKNRREVQRGVHEVGDELNRTGDQADRVNRKARLAAGGMLTLGRSGKIAGRAVVYGTGAMAAGVVGLGVVTAKFTKDAVKGWEDHTKVVRQSRAVIRSTGGAANLTARQVGRLSDSLERKTGVDGDVIQSGANMLLTFKNVRNEQGRGNKIFNQSLAILTDMSVAMKTDASKSAIQLGKALNDPIKGVSALAKVGVTFSDGQKKQIAYYVKTNQMAKAQKIILRELTSEFGGSAKAQMTTGDQVMVGYHALQDTIGKGVIPLQQKFNRFLIRDGIPTAQRYADAFAKDGVPALERYAGIFEDRGIPAIKDFYREARPVAESVLPTIGTGLSTIADTAKVIAPRLKSIFDGFNDLPGWAKSAIAIGAGGTVVGKKLGVFSLGKSVLGGVTRKAPLPVVVTNPGFGGGSGRGNPWARPSTSTPAAGAALTGAQAAGAGAGLFALGTASEYALQRQLRSGVESSMRGRSTAMRGGTTARPDVMAGNQAGESIWRASLAKNWPEVIRLAREYKGELKGSVTSQQQLQRAGYAFANAYGRDLQSVISRLDTADARVNNLRTSLLGLPSVGSYGNGLGVLAPSSPTKKPKVKSRPSFPSVTKPQVDTGFGSPREASGEIHNHFYVDGREITTSVVQRLGYEGARR